MVVIVFRDQVFDDGARFPERDARVGILDGREAAVGVDLRVLRLFDFVEWDVLAYARDVELGEEHADFGGVRA